MKIYPNAKPSIGASERKYVLETLNSGILSLGEKQKAFEREIARFVGVKYACAVSSGTAGLHLALIAAGIKAGDEVITTPFSFVASSNAILYMGAKPVFVDIDPATYNMDTTKLERAVTKKTRALMVVHIFGQSCDMNPILKVAKKYDLRIIEDACESIGATYKGKAVGTFGESAVFAFYPNKQITTGEGGMVVTDNKKIYSLCCSLRNQGRSENMQWLDHEYLGYNYRMDEMSAAVGLAQAEKIKFLIAERLKRADWYHTELIRHAEIITVPWTMPSNTHTCFVYVVRINHPRTRSSRNNIINELKSIGINTKPYLPSIHLFKFYREQSGFKPGDYPYSEIASNTTLSLPFYIDLKKNDITYIARKLAGIVKKHSK